MASLGQRQAFRLLMAAPLLFLGSETLSCTKYNSLQSRKGGAFLRRPCVTVRLYYIWRWAAANPFPHPIESQIYENGNIVLVEMGLLYSQDLLLESWGGKRISSFNFRLLSE